MNAQEQDLMRLVKAIRETKQQREDRRYRQLSALKRAGLARWSELRELTEMDRQAILRGVS